MLHKLIGKHAPILLQNVNHEVGEGRERVRVGCRGGQKMSWPYGLMDISLHPFLSQPMI